MVKINLMQKNKKGGLINRFDVVKSKKNKIVTKKSAKTRAKIYKKIGKILLIFVAIFAVVGLIGGLKVLSWLQELDKSLPSPENIFPEGQYASEIYDRVALSNGKENGTRLYRMFGETNSDPVSLDEIPETLKWSFLAAEDRNFYSHPGFDMQGILRSVKNIVTGSSDPGGGSTVTQQLVRLIPNTTVGIDRTFERKIKEILMSIKLEQSYSKDQILEMYMRVAPMGSNITGVKTGAAFYFGKELKELSLAQSVVLASIVQSPAYLSPTLSIDPEVGDELMNERFQYILSKMREYLVFINDEIRKNKGDESLPDQITAEMIDAALAEDWRAALRPPIATDQKAGHFVNYVIKDLQTKNYYKNERPFEESELQTGGFIIYTTLDYGLQQAAERAVLKGGNDFKYLNVHNSAVMTTIPSTGEIITMAGSKDFSTPDKEFCDQNNQNCKFDPQVNILTALKEPGSTNKPFGYYEAFRQGKLYTQSFLPDVPISVSDSSGVVYDPKNWNYGFDGVAQSAELMLRRSRNLPALFVMQMIGVDRYVEVMKSFGYESYTGQYGLSAILGGVSIKPVEHAQGYGVFANGGDLVKLESIKKIVDKNGEVIYESKPQRTNVADPQAVYLINEVLDNYDNFGTNFWDGRRMSGKTGTSENNIDSWFVAYTPDMVTVSWSGNNNRDPLNQQLGWANIVVFPWLGEYLKEIGGASYFAQRTDFNRPAYVYRGGGGCNEKNECFGMAQGWQIQDRTPAFDHIKNTITVCTDQKDKRARPIDIAMGFSETKTSDYWVSPVPEWQRFIDEHVQKVYGGPNGGPTENDFCTIDRSGGVSGPFFANFSSTSTEASSLNIQGGVFTSNGSIVSTSFSLDGQLIPGCAVAAANFSDFDITCNISTLNLDGGKYNLVGTATDSNGFSNDSEVVEISINNGISSIFNFTVLPNSPLTWGTDIGPSVLKNIQVSYNVGNATNVEIWQIKNDTAATKLGTMTPSSYFFQYNWGAGVPNENARYKFYVTAKVGTSGTTKSITSAEISVVKNP